MKFYSTIALCKRAFLFFLFVPGCVFLSAQTTNTSSPYSRFAIGRPENNGFAPVTALGGSYTAFQNDSVAPFFVNQANPASYAFNRLTSYEFGARYSFNEFTDNVQGKVKKQNGGFNYISLAFPIRKNAGAAFGLKPFSNVGYDVQTYETIDSIGTVRNKYQGSGGINQVYLGFGFRPFESSYRRFLHSHKCDTLRKMGRSSVLRRKRFLLNSLGSLSLGTNVSFMYGTVTYATRKYFPGGLGTVFHTKDYTETQVHDLYYQAGAQMSFDIDSLKKRNLKKNIRITIGYAINVPKNIAVSATHIASNFSLGAYGNEIPFDTFAYQPNYKGRIFLPLMHSVGISIKRGESFMFIADAGMQQWSKFSFLGDNQNLKDQYRISAGMQFFPSRNAIGSGAFFKRTIYRIGARYNTGYLFLKGNYIGEYALTAGLGLPVGKYRNSTVVNISCEYGKAGTMNNNLVEEKFIRFIVGFAFNDRWFLKNKYD